MTTLNRLQPNRITKKPARNAQVNADAEAAALERLLTQTPTDEPISKTVWSSYFPS